VSDRTRQVEVYVAARPFKSFCGALMDRLSGDLKAIMVDAGVCHYMMVVRDARGRCTMFDFGPVGGDIHVGGGSPHLTDRAGTGPTPSRSSAPGEIRRTQVSAAGAGLCPCVHSSSCLPCAKPTGTIENFCCFAVDRVA
jgi:hypothetical protein